MVLDIIIFSLFITLPFLLWGACCLDRGMGADGDCNSGLAGGVLTSYLINYKDIQVKTTDTCGAINSITLCYGKCAYEWQMLDDTGNITQTVAPTNGNYTATVVYTGNFIADTCERITALKKLIGAKLVVIWQDNNGKWYIAGLISPFRLTSDTYNSGLLGTDANNDAVILTAIENAYRGGRQRLWFGADGDADAVRDQMTADGLRTLACLGAANNCGCDVGN